MILPLSLAALARLAENALVGRLLLALLPPGLPGRHTPRGLPSTWAASHLLGGLALALEEGLLHSLGFEPSPLLVAAPWLVVALLRWVTLPGAMVPRYEPLAEPAGALARALWIAALSRRRRRPPASASASRAELSPSDTPRTLSRSSPSSTTRSPRRAARRSRAQSSFSRSPGSWPRPPLRRSLGPPARALDGRRSDARHRLAAARRSPRGRARRPQPSRAPPASVRARRCTASRDSSRSGSTPPFRRGSPSSSSPPRRSRLPASSDGASDLRSSSSRRSSPRPACWSSWASPSLSRRVTGSSSLAGASRRRRRSRASSSPRALKPRCCANAVLLSLLPAIARGEFSTLELLAAALLPIAPIVATEAGRPSTTTWRSMTIRRALGRRRGSSPRLSWASISTTGPCRGSISAW